MLCEVHQATDIRAQQIQHTDPGYTMNDIQLAQHRETCTPNNGNGYTQSAARRKTDMVHCEDYTLYPTNGSVVHGRTPKGNAAIGGKNTKPRPKTRCELLVRPRMSRAQPSGPNKRPQQRGGNDKREFKQPNRSLARPKRSLARRPNHDNNIKPNRAPRPLRVTLNADNGNTNRPLRNQTKKKRAARPLRVTLNADNGNTNMPSHNQPKTKNQRDARRPANVRNTYDHPSHLTQHTPSTTKRGGVRSDRVACTTVQTKSSRLKQVRFRTSPKSAIQNQRRPQPHRPSLGGTVSTNITRNRNTQVTRGRDDGGMLPTNQTLPSAIQLPENLVIPVAATPTCNVSTRLKRIMTARKDDDVCDVNTLGDV